MSTSTEYAVYGVYMEYGEKIRIPVEIFESEWEADVACDRIENENRFNTMYDYYIVDEY